MLFLLQFSAVSRLLTATLSAPFLQSSVFEQPFLAFGNKDGEGGVDMFIHMIFKNASAA